MKPRLVLMDVDTGIDDALALILLKSFENVKVLGVSTVVGNTSLENATRNTAYILDQLNWDIPLAKGSAKPLAQEPVDEGTAHGSGGLGNVSVVNPKPRSVVDLFTLYQTALESANEPVSIIATGPLTNIAKVLSALPHLKSKIERISIMGGAVNMGNRTPSTEFNIIADPEAAQVVFNAGVPITLAMLDVTYQAYLTWDELDALRERPGSKDNELVDMLEFYINGYRNRTHLPGAPLHDSVAVAALLRPELFTSIDAYVEVDCTFGYTRGTTIVDGRNMLHRRPNATVLTHIQREAFIQLTLDSTRVYR